MIRITSYNVCYTKLLRMTTTNTNDVDATVKQIESIAKAGGQMVRMTTQGQREAKNLELIKKGVVNIGCHVPLVADIHYNPNAANIAAKFVEKVRINPGNFVDGAKKFENIEYTNESYQEEFVITSYSIHYTKLYDNYLKKQRTGMR